jgi:TRAP-type mannitol/chloroaromatic compound transport system permease small subunit
MGDSKMYSKFVRLVDQLNDWVGKGVAWLAAAMVALTVYDVGARYLLKAGSVALQELEWHLFAVNFLIAVGWVLKEGGHVRVDLIFIRMSPRLQQIVDLVGSILLCIPFCVLVIWTSIPFVESSMSMGEGSPDPGGLPARYVLKAMLPLGFGLVLLQAVSEALKKAMLLKSRKEA